MITRQRDKIARTETARLTQMYDGSYQDMQRSGSEKFYQDKLGKFRESEHQKVTNSDGDYPQVENEFTPYDYVPYNPTPFPANGKPQARRPGKKQGGEELYNCWIQGHCCNNTKGGPIKLYCTYAFDGPYKKPGILQTRTGEPWVRNNPDPAIANVCAKEVTSPNSCKSEFDNLWCMVHGPTQNREVQVLNLVVDSTGSTECSRTTLCSQPSCTPAITSATTQMSVGQSMQLGATGTCPEKSYYFKLISGGGKVTKEGMYTAPATNPGCTNNPIIALICDCQTVATKKLAVNNPATAASIALVMPTCTEATPTPESGCNLSIQAYYYTCAGAQSGGYACDSCSGGNWQTCQSDGCNCAARFAAMTGNCTQGAHDTRSAALIAAGCCPSQLL